MDESCRLQRDEGYGGCDDMKKLIEQMDQLLAMLNVSGDNVFILANVRQALGEVYRMVAEDERKQPEEGEKK